MTPHIRCDRVSPYVLVAGDPGRIDVMASYLSSVRKLSEYRGFRVFMGDFEGVPVTLASTGIGSPSAAIAVEELISCGAEVIIRVGTCGSLIYEMERGDIVIPSEAIRGEGTSFYYAPGDKVAKPSPRVFDALKRCAQKLGRNFYEGKIFTTDAFYVLPEDTRDAIAIEMECSSIFIIAELKGIEAGAILTVDSNVKKGEGKDELSWEVRRGIEDSIKIALSSLKTLSEKG